MLMVRSQIEMHKLQSSGINVAAILPFNVTWWHGQYGHPVFIPLENMFLLPFFL